jgi:histidine ammonia-lyase
MLANGEPRYGITTGFGDSVDRQISPARRAGNRRPTCSLGASGDLVPLRNLAGALLGDGHVRYEARSGRPRRR